MVCAETPFTETQRNVTPPRIVGEIPDGTVPVTKQKKAEFVVDPKNALETKTYQQDGSTITFQRIAGIKPPTPKAVSPQEITAEEISSNEIEIVETVMAGASIYHAENGSPRSFVQIWPASGGSPVVFWSSADFRLLSGVGSLVCTDGKVRDLMLMWSAAEAKKLHQLNNDHGSDSPPIPDFPDAANNKASFVVTTENPPAATLVLIQSLHDIYHNNYGQLKAAHESRELARQKQEAELKANPPKAKNTIINYWRIEKPSSKSKEKGADK